MFPKFPKINKKIKFASILIAFIFLGFVTHQVLATVSSETTNAFVEKQSDIKTPGNQASWMNEAAGSNLMIVNNALVGDVDFDSEGNIKTGWVPGGLLGVTNQAIASLYTPPFSGTQYIAQTVNNFLGKPVYADNDYQGLSPLIPIWKGFRNITYTIFSLIFIIIGIMIMLRVKISQNAVITIQSAIPKLITSLILVTFSYAIVGLLIDLSYLIEALGVSLIFQASGDKTLVSDIITNPNVFGRIGALVPIAAWVTSIIGTIGGIVFVSLFSGIGWIIGLVAFSIILLALALMVIVNAFKFWWGLLKCYVNILLKTIVGPLEIALGAIPNMKMGFGSWFVDILANVLVFPISMIFLVMVKTLMDTVAKSSNMWTPTGLEGFNGGNMISVAIGLCALVLVSKLPKMIPELIFQIKPSPWGKAIGEGFDDMSKIKKKITSSDYYRQGMKQFGTEMVTRGSASGTRLGRAVSWVGDRIVDKNTK